MKHEEVEKVYENASEEFKRGFDLGWDDCYRGWERDMERSTPPWLRRFFWHSLDAFVEDYKVPWFITPTEAGGDEWCNRLIGIRLWGGVLYVRINRRLRNADSPECVNCSEARHELDEGVYVAAPEAQA